MRKLNVLIACEFSGAIRNEFRKLGHECISADLVEANDNSPYHHVGDVRDILHYHPLNGQPWDLMIAHPPCTYLTVSGNRWFKPEYAERFPDRPRQRQEGIDFKIFNSLEEARQEQNKRKEEINRAHKKLELEIKMQLYKETK